jgi:hypothetical protein
VKTVRFLARRDEQDKGLPGSFTTGHGACIDKACAKAGEEERSGVSQRGFNGWQG